MRVLVLGGAGFNVQDSSDLGGRPEGAAATTRWGADRSTTCVI
jgi:hypothetical protein